jgi:outer membrane protein OmpA-like peptidoglycan-associated protein
MGAGLNRFLMTGAMCLAPFIASASPQYSADDIIKRFAAKPVAGENRSLCIGTEVECRVKASTPAKANAPIAADGSFDLLVNFESNSDRLTAGAKDNLDEFAKALQSPVLSKTAFSIEGHTDAKGSQRFNLNLSRRRAGAVVRYLESKGVQRQHLVPRGYGKLKPRVPDPLDPANRRVEAKLQVQ